MTRFHETPPSIVALGLTWPTTAADIRTAYRTLARVRLLGASAALDDFVELQRAYETALTLVEQQPLTAATRTATVRVTKVPALGQDAYRIDVICPAHATHLTIVPGPRHPGLRATVHRAVMEHEHDQGHRCDTSEVRSLCTAESVSDEDLAAEQAIVSSETVRLRFTIVNLGLLGWRWIVWHPDWRGRDHLRRSDMLDTGLCASQNEAQSKVQEWAAVDPTHEETNRAVYRLELRKWRKDRGAKTARTQRGPGAQSAEYVYLIHEHDAACAPDCDDDPVPYLIVEKTAKSYVVSAHAATMHVNPSIFQRETFVLSRAALEKGKSVVRDASPGSGRWTLKPHVAAPARDQANVSACFTALGLRWPTTEAAVRLAYRRLALERHPDTGGSHDDFLELHRHYRQALSMVVLPGGGRPSGGGDDPAAARRSSRTV